MTAIHLVRYAAVHWKPLGQHLGTFIFGFFSLAAGIVGIAFCKANQDGTKKGFLRGLGLETVIGIVITAALGFGVPLSIAGIAQYFF
jgi:hypothetical protein